MELSLDKRYTHADYLTWADDKVRELIDDLVVAIQSFFTSRYDVSKKQPVRSLRRS